MANQFFSPLDELKDYTDLKEALLKRKGPVQACGCMDSQKVHFVNELGRGWKFQLLVTYSDIRAREIFEDYRQFADRAILYPAKDLIFYSADLQNNQLERERMQVLRQMLEDRGGVVITTMDSLMNELPPLSVVSDHVMTIAEGEEAELSVLSEQLVRMGYRRVVQVEEPGQFCVRGGILDIYGLTQETPCRVEFWGDEVDSVRCFDAESQRSTERLAEVRIYPATEMVIEPEMLENGMQRIREEMEKTCKTLKSAMRTEEAHRLRMITEETLEELENGGLPSGLEGYLRYFFDKTVTFLDYFPPEETMICLDEPLRLKERGDAVETEFRESMSHRLEKGYLLAGQTEILESTKAVLARLDRPTTVMLTGLDQKIPFIKTDRRYSIQVQNMNSYRDNFDLLIQDLKQWRKEQYRVVLLCASRLRAERMAQNLRDYELRAFYAEEPDKAVTPGEILVTYGNLHRGFAYPAIRFAVITESDIVGKAKKKKKRHAAYQGRAIGSLSDLKAGDYVVHETHGLGIYRGIEKVEMDRVVKDYLKIEYGDGGNLYIPATQFNLIQKYADSTAKRPKLNRLGNNEWSRTKSKVKGAVQEIAAELVKLYAARQNGKGYAYMPDTVWQKEFEEMFPYEETDDQLAAVEAAKHDMESDKIMDRLVCGDVGYGKTEIAIRAAFKAVQEGKQVAFLVPTTILAQQHYNTFVQRMKDFPVRVELLSRFRTPGQIKAALADLKKGFVDILIGTHRILSKDVHFKDLGLLIVDEEQRFGVTHKEKIKQMRENVDALTLTATPIPRTLHMSLIGVRDMSVLEEAPSERVPIQTYVMEYQPELVREAINRELARGGQVYYVYNQVKNIDEITNQVAKLVPEANVAFAHGQMPKHQLEQIMLDFINGEIDVLVSTTIIETGLDISNVNTIIIHDSDRFGLSQLYQLRGRVGRSNRTAYAFIMYRRNKLLKEEAQKRLEAIREFTELGSGIKIALRDLEIRGAGNILGAQQHGHMEAVGYDLYCKMLNEAVLALKGETVQAEEFDTSVDLPMDAYIPSSYIRNEYAKLDMYKRIAAVETEEEYMDMQDELTDRFGDIPKAVENLLKIALLKAEAHKACITEISGNKQECRIIMYGKARVQGEKIPELLAKYRNQLKFTAAENPYFTFLDRQHKNPDAESMLLSIKDLVADIKGLLEG